MTPGKSTPWTTTCSHPHAAPTTRARPTTRSISRSANRSDASSSALDVCAPGSYIYSRYSCGLRVLMSPRHVQSVMRLQPRVCALSSHMIIIVQRAWDVPRVELEPKLRVAVEQRHVVETDAHRPLGPVEPDD